MRVDGIVDSEVLGDPLDPWYEWSDGRGGDRVDWDRHPELLERGRLRFSFGGFLVRGGPLGERVVLIDVGNGPLSDDGFVPPGRMPEELRAHGIDPHHVTDVLLTHLHYDHTGWLAVDGRPVFPDATVHVHAADVEHFTAPSSPGLSARLTPSRLEAISSRLRPFDTMHSPVPGITAMPAPGHTPGSTVYVASWGSSRVVFLGDAVHCPVQLVDPEWGVLGDVDPAQARSTREALERELEGADLAGAHFPGLRLGRLVTSTVPRRWGYAT